MASARDFTDKTLEEMERHLTGIYTRAQKEVGEAWFNYLDNVEDELSRLQEEYETIKRTGDKAAIKKAGRELAAKKREKTLYNQHYQRLTEQVATQLSHVNETAAAYINGKLPRIYAVNYNEVAEGVAAGVRGVSFDLVDANTVKRLASKEENLLPYKYVDGKKDIRWNVSKMNSEVLQGIIQGESIPHIADRMENVLGMNRTSAIRNARTAVTGAENRGRMDMLHDAADKGVISHKIWMATNDGRTRDWHSDLDGVELEIDEPFENEIVTKSGSYRDSIMYPGDTDADPANLYNCRCTLKYKVVGFVNPKTGEINYIDESEADEEPKISGVSRGEPMTHAQADSGKVNPNFSLGGGYHINCQSCVATYEARLRGYDVEVVANDAAHPMCSKLARDTSLVWKNKDGTPAEYMHGGKYWTWRGAWTDDIPTAKRFEKLLKNTLEEDGRYHLGFEWKGFNAGHIVTVSKSDDVLSIYDPQSNRTYRGSDVSAYLERFVYKRQYKGNTYYKWPNVMRVDDKDFDFDVATEIMKGVTK